MVNTGAGRSIRVPVMEWGTGGWKGGVGGLSGHVLASVGRCRSALAAGWGGPMLAYVGCRGLVLASVGRCGSVMGGVGLCGARYRVLVGAGGWLWLNRGCCWVLVARSWVLVSAGSLLY